jgi:transcriptional regulator with XRE-family HTH domain
MGQDIIDFVEAEEDLLIDFQFLVQDVLNSKGVSKTELAKRSGISKARLSQILSAEANPSVKTFARLFHALGVRVEPKVATQRVEPARVTPVKSEGKWDIGRVSEEALMPERQIARASLLGNDWAAASNDNYVALDADVRSFTLKAA